MPTPDAITRIAARLQQDAQAAPLWLAGRRPRVGISSCLLGAHVRYDGEDRRSDLLADLLPALLELVPLCPEVAIGMGVPRPPVRLVRLADGREIVRGVTDHGLDVTAALDAYAASIAAGPRLHGYVFKARSPSCAPGSAPLFDAADRQQGTSWGRHAGHLRRAFPGAPMRDEEALQTEADIAAFVLACFRHAAGQPG